MLQQSRLMAFVPSSDLNRSQHFYEKKLGLPLNSHENGALVFQAGKTMLRIAAVPEFLPAEYTILGWVVENIKTEVEGLSSRGIQFERFDAFGQDDRGIWTAPDGARIAWFKDPDGNLLSLTQF